MDLFGTNARQEVKILTDRVEALDKELGNAWTQVTNLNGRVMDRDLTIEALRVQSRLMLTRIENLKAENEKLKIVNDKLRPKLAVKPKGRAKK